MNPTIEQIERLSRATAEIAPQTARIRIDQIILDKVLRSVQ